MSALPLAGTAAVLTAALATLAPAPARAQAAPGVSPAPAAATGPLSRWRLGVTADASWYENAYFAGPQQGESWSTGGRLRLDHTRRFQSGTFGFGGYGGVLYYPDYEGYNQALYGGSLTLNVSRSRRALFRLGASYDHTNTREVELDPEAPRLGTSDLDSGNATVGWTRQVSTSWQLDLGGAFQMRRYADARYADGEQAVATVQLGRSFGRSSSFYTSYGFLNTWFDEGTGGQAGEPVEDGLADGDNRVHQVLMGTRRRPDRGVSVELAGGVAYVESVGEFYPAGTAALGVRGRRADLTVSYKRDFGQAFGYGRQMIGDIGAATFGWTLATRLRLSAGYTYGYRRDPAEEDYTVTSQVASGGLAWEITDELDLSARYSWEQNETEGSPSYGGGRVTGSLSYGVDWR